MMNCRYFACPTCEKYIDAGYRWAYWQLEEPGHIALSKAVNVAKVLELVEYWQPPENERSDWLCAKILPRARRFLTKHCTHGVVYLDEDLIFNEEPPVHDWVETES